MMKKGTNFGLKVLATVLAVVLWTYVRLTVGGVTKEVISQLVLQVPLETRGSGNNLVPYEKSADTITVTLRGEEAVVSSLREGLVTAYVDVADMVSGSHWPEVQILVPQGIQILAVEPRSVNVKLSPPMFKEVPVMVETTGEPKAGFKVSKASFTPRVIRLQGPEALLDQVDKITCLVPVDGLDETFSLTLHNLVLVNSNGNAVMGLDSSIRMVPRQISATIPIQATETIHTLPVTLENVRVDQKAGYSYKIEVEPQFVQVKARPQQALPAGLATESVRFAPSTEVQEKEVGFSPIKGLTTIGSPKVKVRLLPSKRPASRSNAPEQS